MRTTAENVQTGEKVTINISDEHYRELESLTKDKVSDSKLQTYIDNLDISADAKALIAHPALDVVIDATDNFAARYLVHDACFAHGRPLVSAAVHHDEGQLAVFRFDRAAAGPCSPATPR